MLYFPVCCTLTCHTFVSFPEQTHYYPKGVVVLGLEDQEKSPEKL